MIIINWVSLLFECQKIWMILPYVHSMQLVACGAIHGRVRNRK